MGNLLEVAVSFYILFELYGSSSVMVNVVQAQYL